MTFRIACLAALLASCAPTTTSPNTQSNTGVTVKGTLSDALYRTRIENAEVCLVEPDTGQCVRSNANGEFALLDVPKNTRILLRFQGPTYYPNVAHYTTKEEEETLTYLLTSEEVTGLVSNAANVTRDDNKGHVIFAARTGKGPDAMNVTDVSVSLTPTSGEGPFYATMTGFDSRATGTTPTGGGVFFNVEPGTYTVTYSHASKTCRPYYGWAHPSIPNALEMRVLSGFTSYINQICE